MATHTVLLVEDDSVTRNHLAQAIVTEPTLRVIATVESCAAARASLAEQVPDAMLVDLGLPDGNGLDLIREVVRNHPSVRIMVITILDDEQHVVSAIERGASGYLVKDASPEHVRKAIMQLLAGGSPISPHVARYLLKRFQSPTTAPASAQPETGAITKRELEILQLIAKGLTYAETAGTLGLSTHTISAHIRQIYRKLAVHSRSEAVFEAAQRGIIALSDKHRNKG